MEQAIWQHKHCTQDVKSVFKRLMVVSFFFSMPNPDQTAFSKYGFASNENQ
jgi:hypothetical protein